MTILWNGNIFQVLWGPTLSRLPQKITTNESGHNSKIPVHQLLHLEVNVGKNDLYYVFKKNTHAVYQVLF